MRLKTVTDYRMFFYLNSVHKTLAGNYAISSVFLTYIFTKNKPTTVQDSHQRISIAFMFRTEIAEFNGNTHNRRTNN